MQDQLEIAKKWTTSIRNFLSKIQGESRREWAPIDVRTFPTSACVSADALLFKKLAGCLFLSPLYSLSLYRRQKEKLYVGTVFPRIDALLRNRTLYTVTRFITGGSYIIFYSCDKKLRVYAAENVFVWNYCVGIASHLITEYEYPHVTSLYVSFEWWIWVTTYCGKKCCKFTCDTLLICIT